MGDGNTGSSTGTADTEAPVAAPGRGRPARPADPGSVHVIVGGSKTRVVLTGEIDAELGPDLVEAGADAEDAGRRIEVDVQHVTFMDSTGVAFLARLAARTEGLVLIRPPELVRFLIEVTSIDEVLTVVDHDPGIDTSLPDGDGPDLNA